MAQLRACVRVGSALTVLCVLSCQAYLFVCGLCFPLCCDPSAWESEVHARLLLRHSAHDAFALAAQALFAAAVRWIHGAWNAMQQSTAACSITAVGSEATGASISSSPPAPSPLSVPRFVFAAPSMLWARLFAQLKKRASGTTLKDLAGESLRAMYAAMQRIYDAESEAKRKVVKRAKEKAANGATEAKPGTVNAATDAAR